VLNSLSLLQLFVGKLPVNKSFISFYCLICLASNDVITPCKLFFFFLHGGVENFRAGKHILKHFSFAILGHYFSHAKLSDC
jgi:hypothetical protein